MKSSKIAFIALFMAFSACSPGSVKDYQKEGSKRAMVLANELKKIESLEEFKMSSNQIKKHIELIVDNMIEAKKFALKHQNAEASIEEFNDSLASDMLLFEFLRVCQIDGIKEELIHIQQNALHRLDTFNDGIMKKKSHYNR